MTAKTSIRLMTALLILLSSPVQAASWQPSDVLNALEPSSVPREYTLTLYGERGDTQTTVRSHGATEGIGDWHKEKHNVEIRTTAPGITMDIGMLVRVFQGKEYVQIYRMDMTDHQGTYSVLSDDAGQWWADMGNTDAIGAVVPSFVGSFSTGMPEQWNQLFALDSTKHSNGYTHRLHLKPSAAERYWQQLDLNPLVVSEEVADLMNGNTDFSMKVDTSATGEFYFGRIYFSHQSPDGLLSLQLDTQNHGSPIYLEVPNNVVSSVDELMEHIMGTPPVANTLPAEPVESAFDWADEWEDGDEWGEEDEWTDDTDEWEWEDEWEDEWDEDEWGDAWEEEHTPIDDIIWVDDSGDVIDTRLLKDRQYGPGHFRRTSEERLNEQDWTFEEDNWDRGELFWRKTEQFEQQPTNVIYGKDRNALRFTQRVLQPTPAVPNRNAELQGQPFTVPGFTDRNWEHIRDQYHRQKYEEVSVGFEREAMRRNLHRMKTYIHRDLMKELGSEAVEEWLETDVMPFFLSAQEHQSPMLHAVYESMDQLGNITGAIVHKSFKTTNGSWKHYVMLLRDRENYRPGLIDFMGNTRPEDIDVSVFDSTVDMPSGASLYTNTREEFKISFDNRGWRLAYRNDEGTTEQYVLPDESLREWSALVTVQRLYGSQSLFSAGDFAQMLATSLSSDCEDAEWTLLDVADNKATYEWSGHCVGGYQHEIGVVVSGHEALYTASYTAAGADIYDGIRTTWLNHFANAMIELVR